MLQPVINVINFLFLFLFKSFNGNLGLSILVLTALIKVVLMPLTIPSLRSAKKMQDLKPHLDKLKDKHKDVKDLQKAQLDLYKEHGVNPMAGCLPQIVQILVLISLYQVFMDFLKQPTISGIAVNPHFLFLDLTKADHTYVLPVLAGLTQFIFSLMMQSGLETHTKKDSPATAKADKKDDNNMEMAQTMQTQMLYMMPLMSTIVSINFQSGLVLYWVISTVFSIVQQYYFSGLGGLKPTLQKIKLIKI